MAKLFVGIAVAVASLDWATKIVINREIPPIPNDDRLEPVITEDAVGTSWFWIGDGSNFAITHVEHAYASVDDKWRASVYAEVGELVQGWALVHFRVDVAFWVAALVASILILVVSVFVIGVVFRVRATALAVMAGMAAGGAVGNQIELGLFGDVTDWFWVSSEIGRYLLAPLLGGSQAVINFADAAILVAVYAFVLLVAWRLLSWGLFFAAWVFDASTGWLSE